jgi:thiopeptide-type bacteriocin biosynthesis protein
LPQDVHAEGRAPSSWTGTGALTTDSLSGSGRRFAPGSSWLYLRLYGGEASADCVLARQVAQLVAAARLDGLVDKWFFLRYADPDPHLRVRWHGDGDRLVSQLLPDVSAAMEPALAAGLLWQVEVGTYEREIERYGGPAGVDTAERLFEADSDTVLEVLRMAQGNGLGQLRWQLAVLGTDRLLRDLRLTRDERLRWAEQTSSALASEFGGEPAFPRELGRRFRARRQQLVELLDGSADDETLTEARAALDRRSARLLPIVDVLYEQVRNGECSRSVPDLAGSFTHMYANRLLRSDQRASEMVVANWLHRLYRAEAARVPS